MSHWAKVDENNIVIDVSVGDNNEPDEGYQWLIDNVGGNWIKTSYNTRAGVHILGNTPLRKNYAGIGYTYDSVRDAFIPPNPGIIKISGIDYETVLDEETCTWKIVEPEGYAIDESENPFG